MNFVFPRSPLLTRVASGIGGFALADVILGMAGFCTITLASLWMFCLGWIRLQSEYSAIGGTFGTGGQLTLAWIGTVACLPILVSTLFLSLRAIQLPRALLTRAARGRGL